MQFTSAAKALKSEEPRLDDSHAERWLVHDALGVTVFDLDAIDSLLALRM
jgi:hypothetical protein